MQILSVIYKCVVMRSKLPSTLIHSVAVTAKSSILLNFNEKCQSRQNLRDASADWIKLYQDIVFHIYWSIA